MSSARFSYKNQRKLHDFHGGIHPREDKSQTTQTPIQQVSLPAYLAVPLHQHSGKPAKPLVQAGDHVLKGQLIAEADGVISANIHAPSSGTVREISEQPIPHPSGLHAECIIIDTDGKDEWCERITHEDYHNLPRDQLLNIIRNSGLAGMGGAGFPTDVKLHPANHKQINTLVINGVECEPYITADDMLMRAYADEILRGIDIMARLIEPKHIVLAVEDNKPKACEAIQTAIEERLSHAHANQPLIELAVLPTKYPSGGEKQLIYILTGEEVPSGGIPADIGIVCQNVATARAAYRAVRYGEPLLSRITTLAGEQFGENCNAEVLIGTPISHLFEEFGYSPARNERLIIGGPMMGYQIQSSDTPVVKTTNCILAPSAQELPTDDMAQACIRCGLCTEACPAELLPQQLYWFSRSKEYEKAEQHNLADCIECGACAYVCPSSIPLVQYYRHAKGEIKAIQIETEKADHARIRFEARQARLEREAQEKEAKRKARAEAAAKLQEEKRKAAEAGTSAEPTEDPKKAAIAAALARKAEGANTSASTATTTAPQSSPEELKAAYEKAQAKLNVMLDTLEDAKANAPDNVAKFQRAVEKNQLRVNQAKQTYEKALQKAEESAKPLTKPATQPAQSPATNEKTVEELKELLEKAEAKLANMQQMLEDAKENAPDTVEKLQRAVTKNESRVQLARSAYEAATQQQNGAAS